MSNMPSFSPRTLYAQYFDRPETANTMPPGTYRKKNMAEFAGLGLTTEEEFDALPLAVRRKVGNDRSPMSAHQNGAVVACMYVYSGSSEPVTSTLCFKCLGLRRPKKREERKASFLGCLSVLRVVCCVLCAFPRRP